MESNAVMTVRVPFMQGTLEIGEVEGYITHVVYLDKITNRPSIESPTLKRVVHAIDRYASGKKTSFRFRLSLDNYTEFQREVYCELLKVGWGETIMYSELAEKVGTSARAVGQALKRNRHLIMIPCHRVISKHSLGGFSYGIWLKKALLELEHGKGRT
jgi:methylated-DNA-[protein]-cysteine S-methyltransferase